MRRKNALFAGHEVGAENWAPLASVVATCKLSDVNPVAYIAATLEAILNGHPQSRIDDGSNGVTPRQFFGLHLRNIFPFSENQVPV